MSCRLSSSEMTMCFKKIDCHMVFDVKLDLVRKARFVAGGHQTDPRNRCTPASSPEILCVLLSLLQC
jgi:hypothetical protein